MLLQRFYLFKQGEGCRHEVRKRLIQRGLNKSIRMGKNRQIIRHRRVFELVQVPKFGQNFNKNSQNKNSQIKKFRSKIEKVNITIEFRIFELGQKQNSKFQSILMFQTNFAETEQFQSKTEKVNIMIKFSRFEFGIMLGITFHFNLNKQF